MSVVVLFVAACVAFIVTRDGWDSVVNHAFGFLCGGIFGLLCLGVAGLAGVIEVAT